VAGPGFPAACLTICTQGAIVVDAGASRVVGGGSLAGHYPKSKTLSAFLAAPIGASSPSGGGAARAPGQKRAQPHRLPRGSGGTDGVLGCDRSHPKVIRTKMPVPARSARPLTGTPPV
jgi:hypothetical protein